MAGRPRAHLLTTALLCGLAVACPAIAAQLPADPSCALEALPGLASQYARARRESREALRGRAEAASPALDPARAADFSSVARAVLGPAGDDLARAAVAADAGVGAPPLPMMPCTAPVRARDGAAWRMGLSGYSAREIADVLEGHLTSADLDEARRRLMAGQPRPFVASFLEARWRDAAPAVPPAEQAPVAGRLPALADLEGDLVALARQHRVAADLVRAVILAESAGNAAAVSPAGAIGLMQLMPGTAASLGVNPWQPRENLRGGIEYLASLLRAFDDNARLALIAYNAGPQHAREVRDGRAVAYRETRRYLDAIDARYPLPSP